MIGKVTRGSDVAGLLRYVFGPGRHNEHTDPHIVAGWSPDAADLVTKTAAGGFDVRRLSDLLRIPLAVDGRPAARSVWHCSVRAAPDDPVLDDRRWAQIAGEVMSRTGLDQGDGRGVRWVAVRHADDHIHIVATLARMDGTRAEPRNDYYRVAQACHDVEDRFGLRRTAPADRTAGRQPSRAEVEKAARAGQAEPARTVLRREVRAAAATSDSAEGFLDDLAGRGVMVRLRYSTQDPEQVTGYSLAWPEDRVGDSGPAWFGGSKLAPELSWTKLEHRWTHSSDGAGPAGSWADLAGALDGLNVSIDGADEVLGIAAAASLQRLDRGRMYARVDDDVARATRRAWGASRSVGHAHRRVLRAARRLPAGRRSDGDAMRAVQEIVRLLQALARQREAQQRAAQAAAAMRAVTALQQTLRPPAISPRPPRTARHRPVVNHRSPTR